MSHVCGSKTSITCIEGNLSHLIHNSGLLALQREKFISIATKSSPVVNNTLKRCVRHLLEPFEIIGTSLGIFGNVRKSSEHLREFSAIFGSHQEVFGNLGNMDSKITCI